jgi:hypothetical protein
LAYLSFSGKGTLRASGGKWYSAVARPEGGFG